MSERQCRAGTGDESHMNPGVGDRQVAGSDADPLSSGVVVEDGQAVQDMIDHLLDVRRVRPAVGVSVAGEDESPAISPMAVRSVVGAEPRIFVVRGELWHEILADALGPMSLPPETIRVWWPDLTVGSDVAAHPVITPLEAEDEPVTLGEFARIFQLSHPMVRRELSQRDDMLALTEYELAQVREYVTKAEERLRDAHRERHREALRAQQLEGPGS
jgi:hypothetical protein